MPGCVIPSSETRGCTTLPTISNEGKLWQAFDSEVQPVLLIDEIDKADIEFPNDLLLELDRMEFFVYETGERIAGRAHRPIVVITSNNEKELPDAFLRRCFFHYIQFPDKRDHAVHRIDVHYPGSEKRSVKGFSGGFFDLREVPGLKKKALDVGTAGLDQTAGGGGYPRRSAALG